MRERVRHSRPRRDISLQQWDLERARLERLAGSNYIVKFRRRQPREGIAPHHLLRHVSC